nr:BCL-6 corepressor-like protein 1 [Aegilops tauschii subsp. strangulata]
MFAPSQSRSGSWKRTTDVAAWRTTTPDAVATITSDAAARTPPPPPRVRLPPRQPVVPVLLLELEPATIFPTNAGEAPASLPLSPCSLSPAPSTTCRPRSTLRLAVVPRALVHAHRVRVFARPGLLAVHAHGPARAQHHPARARVVLSSPAPAAVVVPLSSSCTSSHLVPLSRPPASSSPARRSPAAEHPRPPELPSRVRALLPSSRACRLGPRPAFAPVSPPQRPASRLGSAAPAPPLACCLQQLLPRDRAPSSPVALSFDRVAPAPLHWPGCLARTRAPVNPPQLAVGHRQPGGHVPKTVKNENVIKKS